MTKSTIPPEGSDEWKEFGVDAAVKEPAERTDAEKEALRKAFPEEVPPEGSEEWMTFGRRRFERAIGTNRSRKRGPP